MTRRDELSKKITYRDHYVTNGGNNSSTVSSDLLLRNITWSWIDGNFVNVP